MPSTKAQNAWNRINTITFTVKLNKHTDEDIIEALDKVESRNGYIKHLIRKDIEGGKQND